MNRNEKLKRNPDLVTADMDGSIVMLDSDAGVYYNLGKTGSFIWQLLEQEMCTDEIVDALVNRYEVDRAQCEAEVFPFIETLLRKNILLIVTDQ